MRLSDFIRANPGLIISEWEAFARSLVSESSTMTPLALRNHIQQILAFITADMDSSQTGPEQIKKSHGGGPKDASEKDGYSAAEIHAALRLAGGFHMDQMVSEYRAPRASIIKLWNVEHPEMDNTDVLDLTRFNEAIDQTLTESISYYTKKLAYSKDMFLGIMGHDLRNPLAAILGSAQLTMKIGTLSERQEMLVSQIIESASHANEIVAHLLDLTRARFGSGLPIIKAPMDFGFVSRQMVAEMQSAYHEREFVLEISGDMKGEWDKPRIGQVFSNLLGNAVKYSFKGTPIVVTVKGDTGNVILTVQNQGNPIPPEKLEKIFDALMRGVPEGGPTAPLSLGLGLYITKEIVTAHGGTIDVTSSEENGTTFTARFPRSR